MGICQYRCFTGYGGACRASLPSGTAVSAALNGSDVLQKMAEEAAKKKPSAKAIRGISGLKVKDLHPPVISLALLLGSGLLMAVLVQMTMAGKSFTGGKVEIALAANLTAGSQLWPDAVGAPRFSPGSCRIALVSVKTNLPSRFIQNTNASPCPFFPPGTLPTLPKVMSKFLDSTLQKVLPRLPAPAAKALPLPKAACRAGTRARRLGRADVDAQAEPVVVLGMLAHEGSWKGRLATTLHCCKLCPAVSAVLNLVNAKFSNLTSKIPLGSAGTLQYALLNPPLTTDTFIELDLKTILHQKEGKEVDLPTDQLSLASLPPKSDAATQLILSAGFLSAELSVLQASFNLDISNDMVLGLPPLVTTMLGALIPEISRALPPSQPVVIEMRAAGAPVVTITPDQSSVQLFSTAEFCVSAADSAPESLFVLDVHSSLEAQFAVAEEKLQLSLALQSLSRAALASSSLGTFDVSRERPLKAVLADVIHVAYVPFINRALRPGLPLPELLGIAYRGARVSGLQNALLLDVPVVES
ncbi:BPI fold-containing family B member 6 [Chlamydotis macqueenii]